MAARKSTSTAPAPAPARPSRSAPTRLAKGRAQRRRRQREVEILGNTFPLVNGCIEVEGHRLNAEQIERYEYLAQARFGVATRPNPHMPAPQHPGTWARHMGLLDLLSEYQPASKAKERIGELTRALSDAALAIGTMREFAFWMTEARGPGCVALQGLIEDAQTELSRLRHFANSIATQDATKLEDWIEREREFERIGREKRQ